MAPPATPPGPFPVPVSCQYLPSAILTVLSGSKYLYQSILSCHLQKIKHCPPPPRHLQSSHPKVSDQISAVCFSLQNPEHLASQSRRFRPCLPRTVPGYRPANLATCRVCDGSQSAPPPLLRFSYFPTQLSSWLISKESENRPMPIIQDSF